MSPAPYNIVKIIIDDPVYSAFSKMGYLQSRPDGRWFSTSCYVPNCTVCGVSRATIFTGRRRAKLAGNAYKHGSSGDAAVEGTMANWYANTGDNMIQVWLQKAGFHTALFGKAINQQPFALGDLHKWPGYHEFRSWLQDDTLGGAHALHVGPAHFECFMHVDGFVQQHFSRDLWTTTGADASGRQGATDYSTDKLNQYAKRNIEERTREPFFMYIATHACKGGGNTPAAEPNRHKFAPASGGPNLPATAPPSFSMPYSEADRPLAFNEDPTNALGFSPSHLHRKPLHLRNAFPNPADATQVAEWDDLHQRKWRMTQAIDEMLRDIVTALKARTTPGVSGTWFDRTIIVVGTEHSNMLGQHRLGEKGVPYEECATAPLFIRHPEAPVGNLETTMLVQPFDLPATWIANAGAQRYVTRPMDGQDLTPWLTGAVPPSRFRQEALIEWVGDNNDTNPFEPDYQGIRTADYLYVEYPTEPDGENKELYSVATDPGQLVNLARDPAYTAVVADLAARLAKLRVA